MPENKAELSSLNSVHVKLVIVEIQLRFTDMIVTEVTIQIICIRHMRFQNCNRTSIK